MARGHRPCRAVWLYLVPHLLCRLEAQKKPVFGCGPSGNPSLGVCTSSPDRPPSGTGGSWKPLSHPLCVWGNLLPPQLLSPGAGSPLRCSGRCPPQMDLDVCLPVKDERLSSAPPQSRLAPLPRLVRRLRVRSATERGGPRTAARPSPLLIL